MKIGIITVARSDYGIWKPIIKLLSKNKKYNCNIIVTGSHFSKKYGRTYKEIVNDNYCRRILVNLGNLYNKDTPEYSGKIMSKISFHISNIIAKEKFDALLLLGDRYEMAAVAMTATPFKIPLIHFHGGAVTTGSFDDNFRHSITKLSNYHMVETYKHKRRIMQMGENINNIKVIGAPSLSDYKSVNFSLFRDISKKLKLFENKFIILNLHPETNANLTYNKKLIDNVLNAIKNYKGKVIITAPNGDIYNSMIIKKIQLFLKKYKNENKFIYKKHLGHDLYFTLLKKCHYLMGNSSSGIIEAASFKKPVVNIGDRQKNREHNSNVIHSDIEYKKIILSMHKAERLSISKNIKNLKNIYYKGNSASLFINFLNKNKIIYKAKNFKDIKI